MLNLLSVVRGGAAPETVPADKPVLTSEGITAAVSDLHVTFTRRGRVISALRGVTLDIRKGEILGLVGESGSGKSVLGLSLLGLHGPGARIDGMVCVNGTDMVSAPEPVRRAVRREQLGAVFQDPMTSLNPTMRVGKQVAEAAGDEVEAERLLGAVGIPDPKRALQAFPHELSGGLRQRVMIAMAVAGNPSLVVADEPTTALDVTVQAQVLRLLRSMRDEIGCSILMITHDLGVASQVADRVAVMYAGRLAEVGSTRAVLTDAAHPYTLGLMRSRLSPESDRTRPLVALGGEVPSPADPRPGCAFAPRCELAKDECEDAPPEPVEVGLGHRSACVLPKEEVATRMGAVLRPPADLLVTPELPAVDDEALSLQAIVKTFHVRGTISRSARLQALRGVDLTIGRRESVALVGESGSGKSTLLRIAAGLEKHDSGTVVRAGAPQMVFQDAGASLTPWMSVEELIGERLRGMPKAQRTARVHEALAQVGLPAEVAKARSGQLSGGQRQRVCLARAIVVPPPLLLCDEPTSALDVSLAASVINLIGRLRRDLDMSVLLVTHDLSVARIVADRIAVMYLGRIVEVGDADRIMSSPAHPYTRALISAMPEMGREPAALKGEPANPTDPPSGCAFHPRCARRISVCDDEQLELPLTRLIERREPASGLGDIERREHRGSDGWVACMNPEGR